LVNRFLYVARGEHRMEAFGKRVQMRILGEICELKGSNKAGGHDITRSFIIHAVTWEV
jgi:hypothetical protein